MARKRQDHLGRAIEDALSPGDFVGYYDHEDFLHGLADTRAGITRLIKGAEADRAVRLLETFIAGCYEKSEEIDDSNGTFGEFVQELFCDWIRARQASKAGPAQTAEMLLSWMEDDDYGYCYDLAEEAVKVLDRAGLEAFEQAARKKVSGARKDSEEHLVGVDILRAVHEERGDVDAYASLCEAEGDLDPLDCEKLAEMCLKGGRPQDALAWVDRGLELEKKDRRTDGPGSGLRLADLKRDILVKLGRGDEALNSAWEAYRKAPSAYAYGDLMKFVPGDGLAEWHSKALAALDGAGLGPRIEILFKTKEQVRLAAAIEAASREELAGLSHYTTEPVAMNLRKSHPLLAAKVYAAMAIRILNAKNSKYYYAALEHLEDARGLLLKNGGSTEWEALAGEIQANHRRKYGFMPGFERLAKGLTNRAPSFAKRARERWNKGAGRRRG